MVILALVIASPATTLAADSKLPQTYAKNENGETYGNNLQAIALGYEADLIAAVGEYGVEGYVRRSELHDDGVTNPTEALNAPTEYYIPLYKSDGETVIGRFKVGCDEYEVRSEIDTYAYGDYSGIYYDDFSGHARSGIRADSGKVVGKTEVTNLNSNQPIGHFGINVQIYNQDTGKLVKSSGFFYNQTAQKYFSRTITYNVTNTSKAFYCMGSVKVWRGIDYDTHGTFRSPAQNPI